MSQLKKGAVLSYINIALTNVVGLLLTPFIIGSLGNAEFGLYTLIGSFVAYLTLMDLGLNNTIIRFVAKYRAEKDIEGEKNFLATVMWVYFGISLFLIVIGLIVYFNLDHIFSKSLSSDEISKAKVMFLILVFNLVITIPGGAFQAICNSYEQFVFPRIIAIAKYILRAVCVVVILTWGGKAISLVIIDTVLNVSVVVITMIFVFKKMKVFIYLRRFNKFLIAPVFAYSFWIFLYGIIQTFQWNIGQLILGVTTNTISVAVFSIGIMLSGYYGAFASAINNVLLPKATQMATLNESGTSITYKMIEVGRINIIISYMILSGFFLFGRDFINLWLGDTYQEAWLISIIIMIVLTIPLTESFGNSILEAKNKIRFKAVLTFITTLIGGVTGYFLSLKYGSLGIVISLASAILLNTIITNLYFIFVFNFNVRLFFSKVFLKQTIFISIFTIIVFSILQYIPTLNWGYMGLSIIVFVVCFFVITYFLLFNEFEKAQVRKVFLRIKL